MCNRFLESEHYEIWILLYSLFSNWFNRINLFFSQQNHRERILFFMFRSILKVIRIKHYSLHVGKRLICLFPRFRFEPFETPFTTSPSYLKSGRKRDRIHFHRRHCHPKQKYRQQDDPVRIFFFVDQHDGIVSCQVRLRYNSKGEL